MYASERQQWITAQLQADGSAKVAELAKELSVNMETIRRDLAALASQGMVRRVHGGALWAGPAKNSVVSPDTNLGTSIASGDEYFAIGQEAAKRLVSGQSLFIGDGRAGTALAASLPKDKNLTVYTNSLTVGMALASNPGVSSNLIGGELDGDSLAVGGVATINQIHNLTCDYAFLSASAISCSYGFTCPSPTMAGVKEAMISGAGTTIVLTASDAFGKQDTVRFAELREVAEIITDHRLDQHMRNELNGAGAHVVCVNN